MKFEDMKTIWDSQNAEPLYAVNEAGLRDVLQEKSRKFRRLMRWQETLTYGSTAFVLMALFTYLGADYAGIIGKFGPLDQLSGGDKLSLVLSAAFWIRFAWSFHTGKQRQAGLERTHASSLLGEIERDLSQVDYQINARGKLVLGLPASLRRIGAVRAGRVARGHRRHGEPDRSFGRHRHHRFDRRSPRTTTIGGSKKYVPENENWKP